MSGDEGSATREPIPLLAGFFALVCAGGAAASYFLEQCEVCQWATSMLGGINLGLVGLIFYPVLVVLAVLRKRTYLMWGFAFAAGVHLALVSALIYAHTPCLKCFATASSAILGVGVLFPRTRRAIFRMLMFIVVVFVLSGVGLLYLERVDDQNMESAQNKAIATVRLDSVAKPVPAVRVRIVYFTRKGCHFCEEFKSGALATTTAEFKDVLETEEREAFDHLPTPMVFVFGKEEAIFKTAPTSEELRAAVAKAK